jgi:four helix bundle protein
MIRKFEDLEVWKESMNMAIDFYKVLNTINEFILKKQIQRALISIPSNIAEGFERKSNKEFIQYLHISKGSCAEIRTQLYLLRELELIDRDLLNSFLDKTNKISAMLYKLIKTRQDRF